MNPDVAFDVITRQQVLVCPKCGVRLARQLTADSFLDPGLACPGPQRWVRRAGQRAS